jgi:hypothetical protein
MPLPEAGHLACVGLINSGGKNIKYGQEIFKLLDVVWAPKQVVVIHC